MTHTVFPATSTAFAAGASDAWLFLFAASDSSLLIITVLNGSAAPLAWLPAVSVCDYGVVRSQPISPGVIDSPQIIVNVNSAGGSAFLSAYPGADEILSLSGAAPNGSIYMCPANGCPPWTGLSLWTVTYSVEPGLDCYLQGDCPSPVTHELDAAVDPFNGTVFYESTYLPGPYGLTFSETGLPSGAQWSVTLAGTTESGTGDIFFNIANGTYPFTIGSVGSYTAYPPSGSIEVRGGAISERILFGPPAMFLAPPAPTGIDVLVWLLPGVAIAIAIVAVWNRRDLPPRLPQPP